MQYGCILEIETTSRSNSAEAIEIALIQFEYDPKRNLLTYDFSDKTFKLAKHELEIEVEDNVGNKSVYKATFFKKYNLN